MFGCLVSSKYTMTATVLRQGGTSPTDPEYPEGHWVERQDPVTGEIIRVWEPIVVTDDPETPTVEEYFTIKCMVRAVIDGGIRVAGTTERYTPAGIYENVDFAKMSFSKNETLTKRDRITNIKGPDGNVIWKEEEFDNSATVFEVLGVSPIADPFGNHIENFALLQRAEVQ